MPNDAHLSHQNDIAKTQITSDVTGVKLVPDIFIKHSPTMLVSYFIDLIQSLLLCYDP